MDLQNLVNSATKLMFVYPQLSLKQRIKNVLKKFMGRTVYKPNCIGWPNGLCALGILEHIKTTSNIALKKRDAHNLMSYFDKWIRNGMKISRVEDFISGYVLMDFMELLDTLEISYSDDYTKAVQSMYAYLLEARKDMQGVFVYNSNQKEDYIFADMIGMVCPFLAKYGVKYNDSNAVAMGMEQLKLFLENAVDTDTNLLYHAYEYNADNIDKLGLLAWGRAIGWVMLGISGMRLSLLNACEEHCDEIKYLTELLIEFGNSIKKYQREDGLFGWHIVDMEGPSDTSATSMILYSLCALRDDKQISNMFRKAYSGLLNYVKPNGDVIQGQAECMGIGIHPMIFGSYPWTVGPTLALLSIVN